MLQEPCNTTAGCTAHVAWPLWASVHSPATPSPVRRLRACSRALRPARRPSTRPARGLPGRPRWATGHWSPAPAGRAETPMATPPPHPHPAIRFRQTSQRRARRSRRPTKTCSLCPGREPGLPSGVHTGVQRPGREPPPSLQGRSEGKLLSKRWMLIRPFKKLHFWFFLNRFVYFDTVLYNKINPRRSSGLEHVWICLTEEVKFVRAACTRPAGGGGGTVSSAGTLGPERRPCCRLRGPCTRLPRRLPQACAAIETLSR